MATNVYHYALGRRKRATARVRLTSGKGVITINGKPADEYLASSKYLTNRLLKPFTVLEVTNKYDVSAVVSGGGPSGQVTAIQLAIAKSLVSLNDELKATLKHADLLGRDPREKERKIVCY